MLRSIFGVVFCIVTCFLVSSRSTSYSLNSQWADLCPGIVPKVWVGYAPAGNNTKTGVISERIGVNSLEECIESCCEDKSCNVIFMYKLKCFQIACYTNDLCSPVFRSDTEKFGKKARMVFIRPVGTTTWPRDLLTYDDSEGMMADGTTKFDDHSCEVGVVIDCPDGERCDPIGMHSRMGICVCVQGTTRNQSGQCVPIDQLGSENKNGTTQAAVALMQAAEQSTKSSASTSPQPSTTPPMKHITVSVVSKEIRLPESEVSLSAYTVPAESPGEHYSYEWKLLSQPADSTGTMQNAASSTLSLAHLSEGVYQFKVTVTGTHSAGEGLANVTVLPAMRLNEPPVAVVTPERQTIKLPNSEAVLDASSSHDDSGVKSYHWELTQGPLGYEPSLEDSPTLQLHNLSLPGNYSFRLTVKDAEGLSSQAQAWVTVVKETDYPPEANAGQDVILYLPRNALTLNGNRSTDDKGISSWEWTKAASDSNIAVDMQDTRTPYLRLSDLEAGVYTFVLKVTDTAGQSSTAEVHVFVKHPNHLPVSADAGSDKTIALPRNWVLLEASSPSTSSSNNPPAPQPSTPTTEEHLSYQWSQVNGPALARFQPPAANASRVNATGLTRGIYIFRLVVTDLTAGISANDSVTVTVLQNTNAPPKAHAGGDKTAYLPLTVLTLNGSGSSDDLAVVKWKWSWEGSSLAQGIFLGGSENTSLLMVGGMVPGQYVFRLRVEDEQGLSGEDTATIIIKEDPQLNALASLTLGAASRSLRRSQLTSLLKQLSLLLHGGASITLREVQEERNTGRAIITFLAERPLPEGKKEVLSGPSVVQTLRAKLRQDPSLLDLPVAHIETLVCQNNCSGHGVCDEATRQCLCEAFWMQDLFEQYFGDGESNCDWSLLYVVVTATALLLCLCGLSWAAYCTLSPICRSHSPHTKNLTRRGGGHTQLQSRRKASYSLLGSQEEEETVVGKSNDGNELTEISPLATSRRFSLSDSDTDSDVLFETRSKSNGSMQNRGTSNGTTKPGPKVGRRIKT